MVFLTARRLATKALPYSRSFSVSALCVILLAAGYTQWTKKPTRDNFIHPPTTFHNSTKMRIVPVPVRSDNYACECLFSWKKLVAESPAARRNVHADSGFADLLVDEATKTAAAVDPYDVKKGW